MRSTHKKKKIWSKCDAQEHLKSIGLVTLRALKPHHHFNKDDHTEAICVFYACYHATITQLNRTQVLPHPKGYISHMQAILVSSCTNKNLVQPAGKNTEILLKLYPPQVHNPHNQSRNEETEKPKTNHMQAHLPTKIAWISFKKKTKTTNQKPTKPSAINCD